MPTSRAIPNDLEVLLLASRYDEANVKFPEYNVEILLRQLSDINEIVGNAPLWDQTGVNLSRVGELAKAEEAFGKAIAERPNFSPPYANRALLYIRLKRYKEAIADLRMCLELNPRDDRVRRMLRDAEAGNWKPFGI